MVGGAFVAVIRVEQPRIRVRGHVGEATRLVPAVRILDIADATLHQQDDYGKLWRTTLPVDGEPLTVVEVVNATPERDGTRRRYFLRVPPTTRTAREAVAWSFEFSEEADYAPAAET